MELNITESQKRLIKASLKHKEAEIEKLLSELALFKELKEVQSLLLKIEEKEGGGENKNSAITITYNESINDLPYNQLWSSVRKAEYILKEAGYGMTTGEIANKIMSREPNIDRTALVSTLSAGLGTKAKDNKTFYRLLNSLSENVYFLLEWGSNNKAEIQKTPNNQVSFDDL